MLGFTQNLMHRQMNLVPASQLTGSGPKFENTKQQLENIYIYVIRCLKVNGIPKLSHM